MYTGVVYSQQNTFSCDPLRLVRFGIRYFHEALTVGLKRVQDHRRLAITPDLVHARARRFQIRFGHSRAVARVVAESLHQRDGHGPVETHALVVTHAHIRARLRPSVGELESGQGVGLYQQVDFAQVEHDFCRKR